MMSPATKGVPLLKTDTTYLENQQQQQQQNSKSLDKKPDFSFLQVHDAVSGNKTSTPSFFGFKRNCIHSYVLPDCVKALDKDDLSLGFLNDEHTVVIDVRPYTSYLASRIIHSLNVCVPTTLLKRKTFTLKNVIGSMQKNQQIFLQSKLAHLKKDNINNENENLKIVLYDDASTLCNASFHLYQTVLKFINYFEEKNLQKNVSIFVINNGVSNIISTDPVSAIIDTLEVSNSPISPASPTSAASFSTTDSSSNLSAITAPNANVKVSPAPLSGFSLPSNNGFRSNFASSIKKVPLLGITYDSEDDIIHLPPNCSLDREQLPNWLKPFLDPKQGFKIAQKNFNKIEELENTRLENVVRLNVPQRNCSCNKEGLRQHALTQQAQQQLQQPQQPQHLAYCCCDSVCSPSAPCPSCDQINYTLPEGIEYGSKNRYSNIWPYEHSRVKNLHSPAVVNAANNNILKNGSSTNSNSQELENVENDRDYFNANYVMVPTISKNRYIATQAPLPSTFDDFWRAIWYNKVEIIVCLTNLDENGIRKSDSYWSNQKYESGIEIRNIHEKLVEDVDIVIRTLEVSKNSTSRLIHQLVFKDWPDFGIPPSPSSIIRLIELKRSLVNNEKSPIAVHCSAGCGRTGTFITIDLILAALEAEDPSSAKDMKDMSSVTPISGRSDSVDATPYTKLKAQLYPLQKINSKENNKEDNDKDQYQDIGHYQYHRELQFWGDDDLIYKTVHELRRQRISMVQTLNQYVICYETILMALDNAVKLENLKKD
ncbi:hypothetical protein PACTADRAFT_50891 [Pachysolen tannophilus NRRL Y-2460]|uniref:protein-tyrosine-phosphatase n=1 Tax=Pachysolen tannophilus NRRL Y-2460 TaxID=669874 RepID=A0A1E4TTL8_PACTA|nr:hypothetical protein PACTADRAFT_50891 [Pachysolen tannophilus NRRL Y-2460]